jgi:hypothetical protein
MLPIYEENLPPYESGSGSSKATLQKDDGSSGRGNETAIENFSEKHCELLGGHYLLEDKICFGPYGMYFCNSRAF